MSSVTPPERRIGGSPDRVARTAAEELTVALNCRREQRAPLSLVLAGGSTPKDLYVLLADDEWRHRAAWDRVEIFFSDERCVPPDDRQSNYRMAKEMLIDPLGLPADRVHRIEGERGAVEAARRYQEKIVEVLGHEPRFDLVLLGVGVDGHTASLFPDDAALESAALVAPARSPEPPHERVTLTLRALNLSRQVIFMVTGAKKAAVVRRLLSEDADQDLPAARVGPADGSVLWLVDSEAAGSLPPSP